MRFRYSSEQADVVAEEWRSVAGWPDYRVSNQGRVISQKYRRPWRELTPYPNGGGYLMVYLGAPGGRRMTRTVHRLVAEAFLGPLPEGLETRHLNGDKLNNAASNLRYGTRSENVADQVAHGVHNQSSKMRCRNGHPYNEANTRRNADGSRECKVCRRETKRRYLVRHGLRAAHVSELAA